MIVLNMEYGKDFSGAGLALLLLFIHSFTRVDITEVISVEQNRLHASLRNCINCVHFDDHFFIFISFPQFIYDLIHIPYH